MEKILLYNTEIQAIPLIRKDLGVLAKKWDIPASELKQITLIIEELFSTAIRFSYEDEPGHQIEVRIAKKELTISIEMIDNGIPFNPMEYSPEQESDPVISYDGGMGITLIKTFSDSIEYRRDQNKNHLAIKKVIRSIPQGE